MPSRSCHTFDNPGRQKESLSEYGSGWGWEYITYAHVFDQTRDYILDEFGNKLPDNTPIRYNTNGTVLGYCDNEVEITNGNTLFNGGFMSRQMSCKPNTGNAGNWYSWPAATASGSSSTRGYNESNSICPSGWQLTVNAETEAKSWYYLFRNTYNIQETKDDRIRILPMSFVRSGNYNQGSLNHRANNGNYWSSTAYNSSTAYYLYFNSGSLDPQYNNYGRYYGFSVRCVSR